MNFYSVSKISNNSVDGNNSMTQFWTCSKAGNTSYRGFLKGCKALNRLGNVIPKPN